MSGLWSFRRGSGAQSANDVLAALPTSAVDVVGSATLHTEGQARGADVAAAAPPLSARPAATLLADALQATETNEHAVDPEWAALRRKWMDMDLTAAAAGGDDEAIEFDAHNRSGDAARLTNAGACGWRNGTAEQGADDARAVNEWLLRASPPCKSAQRSDSPSISRADERFGAACTAQSADDCADRRSVSRGLDMLAREGASPEGDFAPPPPPPPPRRSAVAEPLSFVLRSDPAMPSLVTAAAAISSGPSQWQPQRQARHTDDAPSPLPPSLQQSRFCDPSAESPRSALPSASASDRAAMRRSLARVGANIAAIAHVAADAVAPKFVAPAASSRVSIERAAPAVRPTELAQRRAPSAAKPARPVSRAVNPVSEALRSSQQARATAAAALRAVSEHAKPRQREALHRAAAEQVPAAGSAEFRLALDAQLLRDAGTAAAAADSASAFVSGVPQRRMPPRPPVAFAAAAPGNARRALSLVRPAAGPTVTAPVAAAPVAPSSSFVERLEQRGREREEARRQLLARYEQERAANIARQIQEAEADAQRTLAERSRAAKLRERMQNKMRADADQRAAATRLESALEEMGAVLARRHLLGAVAFFPWRRFVRQRRMAADEHADRARKRRVFVALRENCAFAARVRRTLFVARCVGLTRLLRRWTARLVFRRLWGALVDGRRERRVAARHHAASVLRRWAAAAGRRRDAGEARKLEWAAAQCPAVAHFRERMALRTVMRKWRAAVERRVEERARAEIRSRMWAVAQETLAATRGAGSMSSAALK
jgi:hypothetical protein